MKITFRNLAAIKEAEIDLRKLTIIIGPNNSNKTYLAYSVYGVLRDARNLVGLAPRLPLTRARKGRYIVQLTPSFFDLVHRGVERLGPVFAKKGGRFFQDGSGKLFSETTIGVSVEKSEIEAALDAVVDGFWLSHLREEPLAVSREGAKLIIQDEIDPVPFGLRERRRGKPYISTAFLWDLAHSLAPQPTVFPAERDSLLLTYKLLHKRRYDLLREQARLINKGETAEVEALGELVALAYPRPIEDFLDMLVEIELQREPEGDPRSPSPFAELADLLEEAIHGNARLRFFPKAAGKDLKLTVKGDLSIDLHNASSSVRQLAPLVLFLRHSANRRSPGLLIIDEPELNLHPESQAKLLEILAIYTTLGGRALLTTHSPYLMAHLQNLISGQIDSPETLRAQASSLYLKDARAFLSPENVSAYEVKDETLRSLRDPEFGFTWDTLSDVSGEIQRKYFEIRNMAASSTDEQESEPAFIGDRR
jgi:hypothetical protein